MKTLTTKIISFLSFVTGILLVTFSATKLSGIDKTNPDN